jgi:hypothetical protein
VLHLRFLIGPFDARWRYSSYQSPRVSHSDGPLRRRDGHLHYWRGVSRLQGGLPDHDLAVGCHPVLHVGKDRVVASPAEDVVRITVVRADEIIAGASARPFVRGATKLEAVVDAFAGEVVPAGPTPQKVVVSAAVEIVAALVALQDLISFGSSYYGPGARISYGALENDSRITVGRTRATVDVVGPHVAQQEAVCAESARDVVGAPAAGDKIVP